MQHRSLLQSKKVNYFVNLTNIMGCIGGFLDSLLLKATGIAYCRHNPVQTVAVVSSTHLFLYTQKQSVLLNTVSSITC